MHALVSLLLPGLVLSCLLLSSVSVVPKGIFPSQEGLEHFPLLGHHLSSTKEAQGTEYRVLEEGSRVAFRVI